MVGVKVGEVVTIVEGISTASQEQAIGVQEINSSVSTMDEMTQQNAALVEEAAAARESLDEQAGGMIELMGCFNTGEEQRKISDTRKTESARKEFAAKKDKRRMTAIHKKPVDIDDEWEEF